MFDETQEYEIEKIMYHEVIGNKVLYFVKWKNCPMTQCTWEPEEHFINSKAILKQYKDLKMINKPNTKKKI